MIQYQTPKKYTQNKQLGFYSWRFLLQGHSYTIYFRLKNLSHKKWLRFFIKCSLTESYTLFRAIFLVGFLINICNRKCFFQWKTFCKQILDNWSGSSSFSSCNLVSSFAFSFSSCSARWSKSSVKMPFSIALVMLAWCYTKKVDKGKEK